MKRLLADLVDKDRLVHAPSSREDLQASLARAARALSDAAAPELDPTSRFDIAYTAAHGFALCALRAHELRPAPGARHRGLAFLTLVHTIDAPEAMASSLNGYHELRNRSDGGQRDDITDAEARAMLNLAVKLAKRLLDDGNSDVREHAIEALGNIADPAAFEALRAALTSKDAKVRRAAVEALGDRRP